MIKIIIKFLNYKDSLSILLSLITYKSSRFINMIILNIYIILITFKLWLNIIIIMNFLIKSY